jgi:hypothetical protein
MPPAPKLPGQRARTNKPISDWKYAAEGGWDGRKPNAPVGLMPESSKAWKAWFASWWAVNWTPEDVPQLELAVRLYDAAVRGDLTAATKFQVAADSLGITPKGRASLRWLPPKGVEEPSAADISAADDLAQRREVRSKKLA